MLDRRFPTVMLFLCLVLATALPAAAQTTRPVPAIERAVIVSVDGLRPDLLVRAETPAIRSLMKSGCYNLWARTIPASVTLPSHMSMLTGVSIEKHGIAFNDQPPTPTYPAVPTLFDLAKRAGLSTALVSGKAKFSTFARPGALDWSFITDNAAAAAAAGDAADGANGVLASRAVQFIRSHAPALLVVHLPDADRAGHGHGWGSPEQIQTVESADRAVAAIVSALQEQRLLESTVILTTADHGGAGKSHGPDDPRSRHIPWIIAGPGLRRGFDLTRVPDLGIDTQDTFATVSWLLAIPISETVEGKPIQQIVDGQ